MLSKLRTRVTIAAALGAAVLAVLALPVAAKMQSTKVEGGLCLTDGGGRFVGIPGFPGEKIDRRLLRDIRYLKRTYKIFVTDGFSTDPVHSANGEHPIGLGLDIVPNFAKGGTWGDIDRLAEWAEPKQNSPAAPFRWVGYDGDANHGRGHHLHLSWMHSPAKFGKPADSVYTMRCPKRGPKRGDGQSGGDKPDKPEPPSGGTEAGEPTAPPPPSGGTTPKLAPVAPERAGVGV